MPDASDRILQQAVAWRFLDAITKRFIECGDWRERAAYDIVCELYWLNAAEQAKYPWAKAVTLGDLYAASDRQLRAVARHGGKDSEVYRLDSHIQNLIEQAVACEAEAAAFDNLQTIAVTGARRR